MMNRIGKSLVLVMMACSIVFMTWTVMVYLQFNDFGWKEPKKVWTSKDAGYRVASMLDKRTAVLHELLRQKDRALPGVEPAIKTLNETMSFFPKNHQFYLEELEKVRNSDGEIAPQKLTWEKGELVLDTPGKNLGKPVMKGAVEGIKLSTKKTREELDGILAQIEKITPEIADLTKNTDAITIQLFGTKDDKGNSADIGLYEVLENENTHQEKIRQEIEYITPKYVDAQRRVDSYRDRRASMMKTVTPVKREK
jgi:hypothetical protein